MNHSKKQLGGFLLLALTGIFLGTCKNPTVGLGSVVDITLPVISVMSKFGAAPGSFISGIATIYFDVQDDSGIKSVEVTYKYYKLDADGNPERELSTGNSLAVWSSAHKAYTFEVDTRSMADGYFDVIVTAVDLSGKKTISPDLIYTIKNNPPQITMQIPRPRTEANEENKDIKLMIIPPYPGVVTNTFLMGVYEDLAGIAPGYPLIKMWVKDEKTEEPGTGTATYKANAGWGGVNGYTIPLVKDGKPWDAASDGWVRVDEGFSASDKGEKGGSFRYYLRERLDNGNPYPVDNDKGLPSGQQYYVKIFAADINGNTMEWPQDAFANGRQADEDWMLLEGKGWVVELLATAIPPVVSILEPPPNQLYFNKNFTIKAEAFHQGDMDSDIEQLVFEVTGRNANNERTEVTLGSWSKVPSEEIPNIGSGVPKEFEIELGYTYYSKNQGDPAVKIKDPKQVPDDAYSSVTFNDGNYNFTITAHGDKGSNKSVPLSLYIDSQPPVVEVTSVSPFYSQDSVNAARDGANAFPGTYRRWTVNSTIKIGVNSTDNRGNAIDHSNDYMKFKYLFTKDDKRLEEDFHKYEWEDTHTSRTFGDYLYIIAGNQFFDHIKEKENFIPSGNSNPLIKGGGADGAFNLTLQTHEYDPAEKYALWFYIVVMDNSDNISYQKILLNVNQDTDEPEARITSLNNDPKTNFLNEMTPITFSLSDDDGFAANSVWYRYAKNNVQRAAYELDKNAGWILVPVTPDGDGKTITITTMSMQRIACDLLECPNYHSENEEKKAHRDILGSETDQKFLQIKAEDDSAKKLYPTDGKVDGYSGWSGFYIDMSSPEVIPSDKDQNGVTLSGRTLENPFIEPQKDRGYKELEYAYGDIIEHNLSAITVRFNGTLSKKEDVDVTAILTEPQGNGFAVWKPANAEAGHLRWRFPIKDLFDKLEDGSHTFEITFEDKIPHLTTKALTIYKDSEGPNINLIIPGEKVYLTDSELQRLKNNNFEGMNDSERKELEAKNNTLIKNTIKDTPGKITGNFSDDFSAVFSGSNNAWHYRINNGAWVTRVIDDPTDSQSVPWQIDMPPEVLDGYHLVSIRVKDSHDNGYDKTRNPPAGSGGGPGYETNLAFLIDRAVPVLALSGTEQTPSTLTIYGTVEKARKVKQIAVSQDGKPLNMVDNDGLLLEYENGVFNFSIDVDISELSEGSHSVAVTAVGISDQSHMVPLSFTVDKTPPVITFNAPAVADMIYLSDSELSTIKTAIENNKVYNLSPEMKENYTKLLNASVKDSVTKGISGTISDVYSPIKEITYRFNNNAWKQVPADGNRSKNFTLPFAEENLSQGINRLSIRAKDEVNNSDEEINLAFIYDFAPPVFEPKPQIQGKNSTHISLKGKINKTFAIKQMTVSLGNAEIAEFGTGTVIDNYTKNFTINGYSYQDVTLYHLMGNSFDFDIAIPINAISDGTNSFTISVKGSSDQILRGGVDYVYDPDPPVITINAPLLPKYESGEFVCLTADEMEKIKSAMAANTMSSLTSSLKEKYALIMDNSIKDSVTSLITGNVNDAVSAVKEYSYQFYGDNVFTAPSGNFTSLRIPLDGLENGIYLVSIKAIDAIGNGYAKGDPLPAAIGTGDGYIQNIAFMLDRAYPKFVDTAVSEDGNYILSGKIIDTFAIRDLEVKLNNDIIVKIGTDITGIGENKIIGANLVTQNPDSFLIGAGKSFGYSVAIPIAKLRGGVNAVYVSVKGSSNQVRSESLSFEYDQTPPTITVNTPVIAKDALGALITLDNGEWQAINSAINANDLNNLDYYLPAGYDPANNHNVDNAGIKLSVQEKFALIRAASIKAIDFETFAISGNFVDSESAVVFKEDGIANKYSYTIDKGGVSEEWAYGNPVLVDVTGEDRSYTANWNIPSALHGITEDGIYRLSLEVKDSNGNPNTITYAAFMIDHSLPKLSFDIIGGIPLDDQTAIKTNLTMQITVTDTFAVNSLKIMRGMDTIASPVEPVPVSAREFVYTVTVPKSTLSLGINALTISAKGSSDITVTEVQTIIMDDVAPAIEVSTPFRTKITLSNAELKAINDAIENNDSIKNIGELGAGPKGKFSELSAMSIKDTTSTITGTLSDPQTGIKQYRYSFNYNSDDDTTWIVPPDQTATTWSVPLTGGYNEDGIHRLTNEDGIHRLTIQAVDLVGNTNTETFAYMIDRKAPVVTVYKVNSELQEEENSTDLGSQGEVFIINGKVTNTYWINNNDFTVLLNNNNASPLAFDLKPAGTGQFDFTVTVPVLIGGNKIRREGSNTISISAIGSSSMRDTKIMSFIYDTDGPLVITTFRGQNVTDDEFTLLLNGTYQSSPNATRVHRLMTSTTIKSLLPTMSGTFTDLYSEIDDHFWYMIRANDAGYKDHGVWKKQNLTEHDWTISLEGLADGYYRLDIRVKDAVGSGYGISGSGSDSDPYKDYLYYDAVPPFTGPFTGPLSGPGYEISQVFMVDRNAPEIEITSAPKPVTNTDIDVQGKVTGVLDVDMITVKLGTITIAQNSGCVYNNPCGDENCTDHDFPAGITVTKESDRTRSFSMIIPIEDIGKKLPKFEEDFPDGLKNTTHSIIVSAVAASGLSAMEIQNFIYDSNAPEITVTSPIRDKTHLNNTNWDAIKQAIENNAPPTNEGLLAIYKSLFENSIKDSVNRYIIGNFTDEFSSICDDYVDENNPGDTKYWYRIEAYNDEKSSGWLNTFRDKNNSMDDKTYWATDKNGWLEMPFVKPQERSAGFSIPLPLEDGLYRLSIRVKDTLNNGYIWNSPLTGANPNWDKGHVTDLAFIVDRNSPIISGTYNETTGKDNVEIAIDSIIGVRDFMVKGKIKDTFDVKEIEVKLNQTTIARFGPNVTNKIGTSDGTKNKLETDGRKTFKFEFNVPLQSKDLAVNPSPHDGPNFIIITVSGSSGQIAMITKTFTFDPAPPIITLNTPMQNEIVLDGASTELDSDWAIMTSAVDTNSVSNNITSMGATLNTYSNLNSRSIKSLSNNEAYITGTITDAHSEIDAYWYRFNDETTWTEVKVTPPEITPPEVTPPIMNVPLSIKVPIRGSNESINDIHRLSIRVKDVSGNGFTNADTVLNTAQGQGHVSNLAFMVDSRAPVITFDQGTPNGMGSSEEEFEIKGTVGDTFDVISLTATLNGKEITTPNDITFKPAGRNTFSFEIKIPPTNPLDPQPTSGVNVMLISAEGSSGIPATEVFTFIYDFEKPVISLTTPIRDIVKTSDTDWETINDAIKANKSGVNESLTTLNVSGTAKTKYDEIVAKAGIRDGSAVVSATVTDIYSKIINVSYQYIDYTCPCGVCSLNGWHEVLNINPIDPADKEKLDNASTIFNFSIPLPEQNGIYRVNIKAKEHSDNSKDEQITFMVDNAAPKLTITPRTSAENREFTVSGIVTDTFTVGISATLDGVPIPETLPGTPNPVQNFKIIPAGRICSNDECVFCKVGDTCANETNRNKFTYSFTVPQAMLDQIKVNNYYPIAVTAKGSSGIPVLQVLSFVYDTTGPAIKPATSFSSTHLIETEWDVVKAPDFNFEALLASNNASDKLKDKMNAIEKYRMTSEEITINGTFNDTYSPIYHSTDNTKYWFKIEGADSSPITLKENAYNISGGLISKGTDINGEWISRNLEVADGAENSQSLEWSIPLDTITDSYFLLSMRVMDAVRNGYEITTGATPDAAAENGDIDYGFINNLAFKVERGQPKLELSHIDTLQSKPFEFTATVNGTSSVKKFSVAIDGETVIYGNGATTGNKSTITPPTTPGSLTEPHVFKVKIHTGALEKDAAYSVTVNVEGASGYTDVKLFNFTRDTVAPVLEFNAPAAGNAMTGGSNNTDNLNGEPNKVHKRVTSGTWVTGSPSISGTSADDYGIREIYFRLGKMPTVSFNMFDPDAKVDSVPVWTNTNLHRPNGVDPHPQWSGGLIFWRFSENLNGYQFNNAAIDKGGLDQNGARFYLPLYVYALDQAGNISILEYRLEVDPDMDTPQAQLLTPTPGASVGGAVRLSGIASDNNWIHSVEVRIIPTLFGTAGDGIDDDLRSVLEQGYYRNPDDSWVYEPHDTSEDNYADWSLNPDKAGWVKAKIMGSNDMVVNWYYNVNSDNNLTPPGNDPRKVTVKYRAWDTKDYMNPDLESETYSSEIQFDAGVPVIKTPTITTKRNSAPQSYGEISRVAGNFTMNVEVEDDVKVARIRARLTGVTGGYFDLINTDENHGNINIANQPNGQPLPAKWTITNVGGNSKLYRIVFSDIDTSQLNNTTGTVTLDLEVYDENYSTRATYAIGVDNYYPTTTIDTAYNAVTSKFYVAGTAKDSGTGSGALQGLERVLVYFSQGGTYYDIYNLTGGRATPIANIGNFTASYVDVRDTTQVGSPIVPNFARFPILNVNNTSSVVSSPLAMVIDYTFEDADKDVDGDGTFGEMWSGRTDIEWHAILNTTKFKDGEVKVHYIVMDQAGNATYYEKDIYVGNNRPFIRELKLGTNATGNASNPPLYNPGIVNTLDLNGLPASERGEIPGNISIRNNIFAVEVNALYGNNMKYYSLAYVTEGSDINVYDSEFITGGVYRITESGNTNWEAFGAPSKNTGTIFVASKPVTFAAGMTGTVKQYIKEDGEVRGRFATHTETGNIIFENDVEIPDTQEIRFNQFSTIADTTTLNPHRKFLLKIFDSTTTTSPPTLANGYNTAFENQQLSHIAVVQVAVNNTDTVSPKIYVAPFGAKYPSVATPVEKTGFTDLTNAQYDENIVMNGTERQGYVQYSKHKTPNTDPADISGKVVFMGRAEDNNRISYITAQISDYNGGAGLGTAFEIARWDASAQTLAAASNRTFANMGTGTTAWAFEILPDNTHLTIENGHAVNWRFAWDSSAHRDVAANNVNVTFRVYDFVTANNANPMEAPLTVNAVPYITGIETPLSSAFRSNPSAFDRSSTGWYSVREGQEITINGFNLANGTTTNVTVGTGNTALTTSSVAATKIVGTVATASVSGPLVVTVNNITSLNNRNNANAGRNLVSGNYVAGTGYNDEANGLNNNILTDDRFMNVWSVGSLLTRSTTDRNLEHPFMTMSPTGHRFLVYGTNVSSSALRLHNNTAAVATAGTSIETTTNRYLNLTVAADGNGLWYLGASNQTAQSYNSFNLHARGAATGSNNTIGQNKTRILSLGTAAAGDANRVKIPRIHARNVGTNDSIVVVSYGNNSTTYNDINLHYGRASGASASALFSGDFVAAQTGNSTTAHNADGGATIQNVTNSTSTYKGSQYTASATLSDGRPVIAWYDREKQSLIYSFGNRPAQPTTATTTANATEYAYAYSSHGMTAGTAWANRVYAGAVTATAPATVPTSNTTNYPYVRRTAEGKLMLNTSTSATVGIQVNSNTSAITIPIVVSSSSQNVDTPGAGIAADGTTQNPTNYNSNGTGNTGRRFYVFPEGHGIQPGDRVIYSADGTVTLLFAVWVSNANNRILFNTTNTYPGNTATTFWQHGTNNTVTNHCVYAPSRTVTGTAVQERYYTYANHGLTVGQNINVGTTASYSVTDVWASNNFKLNVTNLAAGNITYSTSPSTATNTTATTTWQGNAVEVKSGVGTHVDLAVDGANNVHLAYYDVFNGGLWYSYIPSAYYNAANETARKALIETVKVDTYLSAGTKIMINVREEISNGQLRYMPYISYFHASFNETRNSLRVAWLATTTNASGKMAVLPGTNESDYFTGNWEVMTVPAINVPLTEYFTSMGVPRTSGNWVNPTGTDALPTVTNIHKKMLVGYMTDTRYEGAVLKKDLW